MLTIVGMIVVIGAVIGGFLMEKGKMGVLMQPAEIVIIGGAAIGTLLIANPLPVVLKIVKSLLGILKSNPYSNSYYLETLKMLNELFSYARKSGMSQLESDVEEPEKSKIFSKYSAFVKNHHAVNFVCDTLRMSLTGGVGHFELDQMMELDMEVHHREVNTPVHALNTMAESLPGLGIVAAVLGVVITMGALGGPPEEIGHKVAAALVGTFLGILLCYGFVGPLAASMTKANEAEAEYYHPRPCAGIGTNPGRMRGSAPVSPRGHRTGVKQVRHVDAIGAPLDGGRDGSPRGSKGNAVRGSPRSRGCPRNCKRRALHHHVTGSASREDGERAATREPGDLPSAVVTRETRRAGCPGGCRGARARARPPRPRSR